MTIEVGVDSLSPRTTEETLRKYFSLCGRIEAIKKRRNGAFIVFTKESAARTVLLLNGAFIDGRPIATSVEDGAALLAASELPAAKHADDDVDLEQEDKPHTAKFAEVLAHDFKLSDLLIERAIVADMDDGISNRFQSFFSSIQSSSHSLMKTAKMTVGQEYYSNALAGPDGKKVQEFYCSVAKEAAEVREEGLRIQQSDKVTLVRVSADQPSHMTTAAIVPSEDDSKPVYHVDFGWFRPIAAPPQQDLVNNRILNLAETCGKYPPGSARAGETCLESIPYRGRNISPHGHTQGYVDTFVMRFPNRAARDFYMEEHPGHGDIRSVINPLIAKIMIVDFEDGNFLPHDAVYQYAPSNAVKAKDVAPPDQLEPSPPERTVTPKDLKADDTEQVYQIVVCRFHPWATPDEQATVQSAIKSLTKACATYPAGSKQAGQVCLENFMLCGRNISPHGKHQGYHDIYIMRLPNRAARNYYMEEHPARSEIWATVTPYLETIMIFDFVDTDFYPDDAVWKYSTPEE